MRNPAFEVLTAPTLKSTVLFCHRTASTAATAAVVAYAALPRRLCYASEAGGDASGGGDRGGLGSSALASLPLPLPLPRTVDAVPPTRPGPDLMKWVKCVLHVHALVLLLLSNAPDRIRVSGSLPSAAWCSSSKPGLLCLASPRAW